jgi:hypothetical protein
MGRASQELNQVVSTALDRYILSRGESIAIDTEESDLDNERIRFLLITGGSYRRRLALFRKS